MEAYGCDPAALSGVSVLRGLFARIVDEMGLEPVGEAQWHRFPGAGGVTGLCLLAESHLAVHTWPEHASLCLNLFCCKPRPAWDFEGGLAQTVGAAEVRVRMLDRTYAHPGA